MFKKNISLYADKIFTGGFTGIFLFGCVISSVFFFTFDVGDSHLKAALTGIIRLFTENLALLLHKLDISPALHSLIIDGLCAGIGSVLSFIPTISVLFFCLSVLKESGYMDRAAIAMARPMSLLGLPGKAVVSLVSGFGCSVPAIISTADFSNKNDMLRTIFFIPFMSCSAKLPIYVVFTEIFFPKYKLLIIGSIYFLGILCAMAYAVILKVIFPCPFDRMQNNCSFSAKNSASLMTPYKIPSLKPILQNVWQAVKGFIKKAFTVILIASLVIWLLQNFDIHMNVASSPDKSMLAYLGRLLSPLFAPLGFDDWRAAASIITGMSAKEAVIGTLTIISESSGAGNLTHLVSDIFSPLSAFSFMVFCLLYFPCIPSVTAVKNTTGKWSIAIYMLIFHTALAWVMSFVVFNTGRLISYI